MIKLPTGKRIYTASELARPSDQGGWDHRSCVRQVVRARNIMRAILNADERGQGVNFSEAMDAAEAFCCEIEAHYEAALKEVPHAD